jgi:hypothetical protein
MTTKEFIGVKVHYDNQGQKIWGVQNDGEYQMIADVRGWGAIQNLFLKKSGRLNEEKATAFQDELGQFIVDAINEKLNK